MSGINSVFQAPKATSPWENQIGQKKRTEKRGSAMLNKFLRFNRISYKKGGKVEFPDEGMAQVKKRLVV